MCRLESSTNKKEIIMSEKTFSFKLARPAKSQGGDRYEVAVEGEVKPWAIYVPQSISRSGGSPAESLAVTIKSPKGG